MNSYLVDTDSGMLLIDTGYPSAIENHVKAFDDLDPTGSKKLSMLLLRAGEFNSTANAGTIHSRRPVDALYGPEDDIREWVFDAEDVNNQTVRGHELAAGESLAVDVEQTRRLEALKPPLRLLKTRWLYDSVGKVMHTSDMFGHAWADSPDGPFVIADADTDTTTAEQVAGYFAGTRYWWLPHADTAIFWRGIQETFDRYDVEVIAPAWGCVLQGRSVIEKHLGIVGEVLGSVSRSRTEYIGSLR